MECRWLQLRQVFIFGKPDVSWGAISLGKQSTPAFLTTSSARKFLPLNGHEAQGHRSREACITGSDIRRAPRPSGHFPVGWDSPAPRADLPGESRRWRDVEHIAACCLYIDAVCLAFE